MSEVGDALRVLLLLLGRTLVFLNVLLVFASLRDHLLDGVGLDTFEEFIAPFRDGHVSEHLLVLDGGACFDD